jgi:F0F1-type ATP synthase gamma subunit
MFDVALEPNEEEVKNSIKGMIINYAVYGAVLHNKTGEFAARMLAMK